MWPTSVTRYWPTTYWSLTYLYWPIGVLQTLLATAISSAEVFGWAVVVLMLQIITPGGILSAEAFGPGTIVIGGLGVGRQRWDVIVLYAVR